MVQESFFTVIERDPVTCQVVKEVSCKSVVTMDEDGNVIDSETLVLDTKTFEVAKEVVNGNNVLEPSAEPDSTVSLA